jgi:hypothetical protein
MTDAPFWIPHPETERSAEAFDAALKEIDRLTKIEAAWKKMWWYYTYGRAQAETGWQPIATAPAKRLVLVALIDGEVIHRVSDARNSGLGWFTRNGGVSCHWATHWAPMPPWWPNGVPAEETP